MTSLSAESPDAFIKHAPRQHQAAAVQALMAKIGESGRAQVIHPCGAGKTRTSAMFADELGARVVLIALPSLGLVAQTMPEWAEQFEGKVAFRAVCSDRSVSPNDERMIGQGRVLADVDDIALFLASSTTDTIQLLFTTYQSSPKVAAAVAVAHDFGWTGFDLIVCDEAHRLAGKYQRPYTTVLRDDEIPAKRRLFLTATPRISSPIRASEGIVGMENPFVFGHVAHRYTFAQATADGILSEYKVTLLGISPADLSAVNWDDPDHADVRHHLGLVATLRMMHATKTRRMVTFHSTKSRAEKFAEDLDALNQRRISSAHVDDLHTISIHSGDSPNRRRAIMRMLGPGFSKPLVVSNPRVLTEGIDVPALDGVVFVDPRGSIVDIVQAIGRALRVCEGKTVGHIVIPVLMDPSDTAEEATLKGGFETAWRVLSTLREYDDSFSAWVDDTALNHVLGSIPKGIEFDFSALGAEDAERLALVAQLRMVNEITATDTGKRTTETVTIFCECCGKFPVDEISLSDNPA